MHSELRERLRKARIAERYSQPALARAAGCSRGTIGMLEAKPDHDPRLSVMRKIARVLGDPHLFCCSCADCDERAS